MNTSKFPFGEADDPSGEETPITAESLRRDFNGLIDLFDRHLATLTPDEGQAWEHLSQAKAAAQRGLKLSRELIEIVKSPD